MLERKTSSSGVGFYHSPLLAAVGVRHAFSTRVGGVSSGPFDSLNLGNPSGCDVQDDYERIWANYARLLSAVKCNDGPPIRVHQVHGNAIVQVTVGEAFDNSVKADGIVSSDAERAISVRVADCVPVLLSSADGKTVAAVHAGWRGVVAGVVPAAIARMKSEKIIAAIGPCISEESFEVGEEVLLEFEKVFGERAPVRRVGNGKGRVDLPAAIQLQLLKAGVKAEYIDRTDRCTFLHADEFFSHRRERGITGRMAAVICAGA